MTIAAVVVGTVAASNAADVGVAGHPLIAVAAAVLFGPDRTCTAARRRAESRAAARMDFGAKEARSRPLEARLQRDALTIDGAFREIEEPPKLAGGDPRWGR
jgi:hypothetical protein